MPNAMKREGTIASSISAMLRYIESILPLSLAFGDVPVSSFEGRESLAYPYSWSRNSPSQCVIWLGSLLLHVTRNITRQ